MTDTDMRILKTATCKSISGKSTLTYQIGCTPDNAVHIRISKNTGAGFFNPEWIKLDDIQKTLAEAPEGQPLTSFLLQPLFKGRSVNSPAFHMAALSQEKLLRVLKGKKRGHELLDPDGFHARMDKLVTTGKSTGATRKKSARKVTTKKDQIKKKAAARKKQRKTG
jgi:hypothetical protein